MTFYLSEPALLSIVDDETTNTSIAVTFTWPEELESNITGFIIQYRPAGSMDDFSNSSLFGPDEREGNVSGLVPEEEYEVRVVAVAKPPTDPAVAVTPVITVVTTDGE